MATRLPHDQPYYIGHYHLGRSPPVSSPINKQISEYLAVRALIKDLVAGQLIRPEEPWIRECLEMPAKEAG